MNKITISKGEFALRLLMEDETTGKIIKEEYFSTVGATDEEVEMHIKELEFLAKKLIV